MSAELNIVLSGVVELCSGSSLILGPTASPGTDTPAVAPVSHLGEQPDWLTQNPRGQGRNPWGRGLGITHFQSAAWTKRVVDVISLPASLRGAGSRRACFYPTPSTLLTPSLPPSASGPWTDHTCWVHAWFLQRGCAGMCSSAWKPSF